MSANDANARALARFRRRDPGKAWTWNGLTIYGSTSAISDSEVSYFLPDAAKNLGDIDPRATSFSPAELPSRTGPKTGDVVIRNATSDTYLVERGYLTDGQAAWRCIMYKLTPTNSLNLMTTIITARGTSVLYSDGTPILGISGSPLKALLEDNEKAIEHRRVEDSDIPEKQPFVWKFTADALGVVSLGMKLLIGGVMYLVDPPFHPNYEGDTLIYLAVPTHML